MPPRLVEFITGLSLAAIAAALRMALSPLVGGVAPYAIVFVAITGATVLAGWRSGLIALLGGQLFTWWLVVDPSGSLALDPERRAGLLLATAAELVVVVTLALYQREVDKGTAEREQRLTLLDEALKEIDHRTRNNYQTVLALIDLQARRAGDEAVRAALAQVAERIEAISKASQRLAVQSADLAAVRLDDHLCGLVQHIERGLSREEIEVACDVDTVTASADKATSISIIVNELVTNAIKHAFNGERSGQVLVTGRNGTAFELIIADNGLGIYATRSRPGSGLGTKLVESFARQLGAQHQVTTSERGTTHRLVIPNLD